MKKTIATLTVLAALVLAPSALAAYGDYYGAEKINGHPLALQPAPAIPGNYAFWAGACDRGAAPGIGVDMGPLGGFGARPAQIVAATEDNLTPQGLVDAPTVADHCIDHGAPALHGLQPTVWQSFPFTVGVGSGNLPGCTIEAPCSYAPKWRLPAATQAGSHPDGSTLFAWAHNRDVPGSAGLVTPDYVDGSVDNVHVDLPPGFVADPAAVDKCTAEQFGVKPLRCPPSSQVGVLRLHLTQECFGTSCNYGFNGTADWTFPVYNLEPRQGNVAELGFAYAAGVTNVRLVGRVRTNGDYGVSAFTGQIPAALVPIAQTITLWGVPWAAENDLWRTRFPAFVEEAPTVCKSSFGVPNEYIPPNGLLPADQCQAPYDPSWGPIKPFVSAETDCNPAPAVRLATDAYQNPGAFTAEGDPDLPPYPGLLPEGANWRTYESISPGIAGCEQLPFNPTIVLDPTKQGGASNAEADSPTGLDVELSIPQNNQLPFDPPADGAPQVDVDQYVADAGAHWRSENGLATAHLRDTVVTLPEGMTLNPAAAAGQGACTMAQIGVTDTDNPTPPKIRFDNQPVACPESSKVADVVVETPLLEEADWPEGSAYLAKQGENPFGSDFAIYIALESPDRGLRVKLAGKVAPDPVTGRLTTTFAENPELPFDTFRLRFKAGPQAPLATPVTCGTHTATNSFASHARPSSPVAVNDPMQVTSSPAGGCAATPEQRPFSLGFSAGSTELVAGSHTPFTARFTRGDGNQELDRVELTTPEGFAAKLAGVPYCPEASIAQAIGRTATGDGALEQASPSCSDASKVGTTTIGAGAGSQPFFVKGDVYLAGPYRGAPVSLAFVVPAVAGPFDLGVQVVRTALQINPKTAQVTAVSDTIPKILRGVPLRLRDVRVDIDRNGFALNPTDCSEMAVTGRVFGANGAQTNVSNRFQIAECARLGFKPKLTLRLNGGTKRAKYQGMTAIVTPRPGDANIARTAVTLPHSAFLAQEHIRTICTRVQFAADACPAGAIYGKATAWTPLLDQPLTGNVYLRSSDNPLPDLVADLRGPASQPIRVELSGRTDSIHGGIRNTFDVVPDAAVSRFRLDLFGGRKGLIVNSQDLCESKRHLATVRMTAQNGRTHNFRPVVKNGCGKKKSKKAKRNKGH
jgi:hypothetical protein